MAGENGVTVLLMLLIAQHLHRFLAPARLAEEQFLLSRSGGSCVRRVAQTAATGAVGRLARRRGEVFLGQNSFWFCHCPMSEPLRGFRPTGREPYFARD